MVLDFFIHSKNENLFRVQEEQPVSSNGRLIANDEHLQIPFSTYFIIHLTHTHTHTHTQTFIHKNMTHDLFNSSIYLQLRN